MDTIDSMVTIADFEDQVWSLEGVRIVVRATQSTMVKRYDYSRKIAASTSVTDWGNGRIKPLLCDLDFYVVDGSGTRPHGRTNMGTIRDSYN